VTTDDLTAVNQLVQVSCCQKWKSASCGVANYRLVDATFVSAASKQARFFNEDFAACRQHGRELKQGCIFSEVHMEFLTMYLRWYTKLLLLPHFL